MSGLVFPVYMFAIVVCVWAFGRRTGTPGREVPYGAVPAIVGATFVGLGLVVGLGPDDTIYVVGAAVFVGVGGFLLLTGTLTLLINLAPAPPWRRRA